MQDFDFVIKVLKIFEQNDDCESLLWSFDNEENISFFVNCSDLFFWACADAQEVTEENVSVLAKAYEDAKKAYEFGECYGSTLFCCRTRGMRPQKPYCKHIPQKLMPLFDACGEPLEGKVIKE